MPVTDFDFSQKTTPSVWTGLPLFLRFLVHISLGPVQPYFDLVGWFAMIMLEILSYVAGGTIPLVFNCDLLA